MQRIAAVVAVAALATATAVAQERPSGRDGQLTAGQQQVLGRQQVGVDIVYDVQTQLRRLGYPVGPVDGIFGPNTRTALGQFQRDRGLDESGRIDRESLAALGVPLQTAGIEVRPFPADEVGAAAAPD